MPQMEGKVALVTGAARGLGRSHALTLAGEGADLVLVDIAGPIESVPYALATPGELEQTARDVEELGRRAIAVKGDIRDQAALDQAVAEGIAEFGHIDAAVANAGVWSLGDVWKLSDEEWHDIIEVNLTGHWRTVKAVAPHMIERGSGSIVMIASVNALEAGPRFAHYAAAKAGLLALMRNVAVELGPHGIRCNAVCPGAMDTEMHTWQGALDFMGGRPNSTMEDRAASGQHYSVLPGRSMLPPASASNAVLWLASDATAEVTGVAIPVDAGHMVTPGYNPSPS
jgi:SDR family mycofactocin-dependent oxidoreductase